MGVISAVAGMAKAADAESEDMALTRSILGDLVRPSTKTLGRHMNERLERWLEGRNERRVIKLAAAKVKASEPGSFSPRAMASVLDAAEFGDDEFVTEYLSGVLASAKTPGGKDDSAVTWSALVDRLPADALKMHYVIYSILQRKMRGQDVEVVHSWCKKPIIFTYLDLIRASVFDTDETPRRTLDALYTLQRENLLGEVTHGDAAHFADGPFGMRVLPLQGDLVMVTATFHGMQLFMQGHGYGQLWPSALGEVDRPFNAVGDVDPGLSQVRGVLYEELPERPASENWPGPGRQ